MDPDVVSVPRNVASTLIELYEGMLEAGSNGIGYSPKVHEAMKKLKADHPVGIQLAGQ